LALFQIYQTTLSVENYCSADKKSLKAILGIFMEMKVSLVKKNQLIYDWVTFVLTIDMQIAPRGSNLNSVT